MKILGKKNLLICLLLSISLRSIMGQGEFEGGEGDIMDPSLAEEEQATGMENVGNGDALQDETLSENQINPNEENDISQAMSEEGMSTTDMFGGGEDGEMINQMGMGDETTDQAANELEQAEEHGVETEHNQPHHEEELSPSVEEFFREEEENNNHHQVDHEIPEENIDHEHEHQGDHEIPEDQIIDHGLIAMEHHTELEKMRNFKKISDDCKVFLEDFRDCLDNIPDPAWDEEEIQKCVGKDFTRVVNDICKLYIIKFNY